MKASFFWLLLIGGAFAGQIIVENGGAITVSGGGDSGSGNRLDALEAAVAELQANQASMLRLLGSITPPPARASGSERH